MSQRASGFYWVRRTDALIAPDYAQVMEWDHGEWLQVGNELGYADSEIEVLSERLVLAPPPPPTCPVCGSATDGSAL